jgi:dUTP pyrophosphatase
VKIKIKKMREEAVLPKYQTAGAAGFDFHACVEKSTVLKPGEAKVFHTGLGVEIPEGYELQIRPRSGLAFKYGVTMLNGVGTIDSDFRGEMCVILRNFGEEDFVVEPGMRIAQGVVSRYEKVAGAEVEQLSETGRRGGLGSTGV